MEEIELSIVQGFNDISKDSLEVVDALDVVTASVEKTVVSISKLIENIADGIGNINSEIVEISDVLTLTSGTLERILYCLEKVLAEPTWYESVYNATKEFLSFVNLVAGTHRVLESGIVVFQEYAATVKAMSFEMEFLAALFPKLSGIAITAGSWISGIGAALTAFGGSIISALEPVALSLGTTVGWVVAAIAAIIASIAALVIYWDEVCAFFAEGWNTTVMVWSLIGEWFDANVVQPMALLLSELWGCVAEPISECWNTVTETWNAAATWFQQNVTGPFMGLVADVKQCFLGALDSIRQTFSDVFYNVGVIVNGCWTVIQSVWTLAAGWFDQTVIQPVSGFFSGLWEGFLEKARAAWEGVKSVFSAVGGFFKDVFSSAWQKVVSVFSAAGNIFVNIKDAIVSVFKTVVNGIIKGLNSIIAVPFKGINGALTLVKNIDILGLQPFSGLQTISVPQIPLLAQGAVLPANKPFMAIVGDQKHGTNIEAPLATIQEAVALVMRDQTAAIMAGFNASVEVQREILSAVLGIQIGDDVIASAYDRYQAKLTVQRGG